MTNKERAFPVKMRLVTRRAPMAVGEVSGFWGGQWNQYS